MEDVYGKLTLILPDHPEQEYDLAKSSITIGRAMTNDIILGEGRVSRSHARIDCGAAGCKLSDLGSSNGTRLNGSPIRTQVPLQPGDLIEIGNSTLRFDLPGITPEADMTMIDSDHELDRTIDQEFLPMVINETSLPRLVIFTAEKTWEVTLDDVDSITIGRTDENEVVLPSPKVSREHARIVRTGNAFTLRDLGSTNGTLFNHERVDEMVLQDGDLFRIGDAQLAFKSGFAEEALTMADESLSKLSSRRPVIFIPGFMGSQLWQGSERIFPHIKMLFRNPDILSYSEDEPPTLEPRGIVDEVVIVPNLVKVDQYNRMGDYLVEDLGYERGVNFFEFAYDWRQDVRRTAKRLAEMIENLDLDQPITIIAHSLGTLVTRYYLNRLGGDKKVERVMLMGGPHQGVPKVLMSALVAPDFLPFGIMGERLRQLILHFPTIYQILPTYACSVDQTGRKINFFENESWLAETYRPMLRSAREFRMELGNRVNVPAISIFGYGLKTVMELSLLSEREGDYRNIVYRQEPSGDSTIPQRSAVLEGSEIHPVKQYHGALFVDNDVKMRLKMELTRSWDFSVSIP